MIEPGRLHSCSGGEDRAQEDRIEPGCQNRARILESSQDARIEPGCQNRAQEYRIEPRRVPAPGSGRAGSREKVLSNCLFVQLISQIFVISFSVQLYNLTVY